VCGRGFFGVEVRQVSCGRIGLHARLWSWHRKRVLPGGNSTQEIYGLEKLLGSKAGRWTSTRSAWINPGVGGKRKSEV